MQAVTKDFRNFLFLVWEHVRLRSPTKVQYDIAKYLQHGPERTVIQAFRGGGKSWVTSAFVCWTLLRDPQEKIMVVSADKTRADAFSSFTRRLIDEMEILAHLRPKPGMRTSKIAFDVGPSMAAHAPSVKSVGITGQMTGSRATLLIADDIEVLNNSLTQPSRDFLAKLTYEFESILSPGGRIIYLGTPQNEYSLYSALPERGYTVRVWPLRTPPRDKLHNYKGNIAPLVLDLLEKHGEGFPVDIERFTEAECQLREATNTRAGFQLQFMLDTTLSDLERYPLKLQDLIVIDCDLERAPIALTWGSGKDQIIGDLAAVGFSGDYYTRPIFMDKEWVPYSGSVMFIDPSGRGSDETAYAVVKYLHGKLFLVVASGLKGGYDEATLKKLANIAKEQAVNLVLVESNWGDGMFTQLCKPVFASIYPVTFDEVHSKGQKERRILDTLEPVIQQHRLVVDRKVIEQDAKTTEGTYQLFYQMSRITRDRGSLKHDDRLEAVQGAVSYWVEHMARDEQQAVIDYQTALLDKQLQDFTDLVHGQSGNYSDNFVDNL